jgi:hypothetical protein
MKIEMKYRRKWRSLAASKSKERNSAKAGGANEIVMAQ